MKFLISFLFKTKNKCFEDYLLFRSISESTHKIIKNIIVAIWKNTERDFIVCRVDLKCMCLFLIRQNKYYIFENLKSAAEADTGFPRRGRGNNPIGSCSPT